MLSLLKVFFRGLLTTILLPVIIVIWVIYGVYLIFVFIFMFFKSIFDYFSGRNFSSDLIEDLEAKRALLEEDKKTAHSKDLLNAMYEEKFGKDKKHNKKKLKKDKKEKKRKSSKEENDELEENDDE